jgi:hypothetical protein
MPELIDDRAVDALHIVWDESPRFTGPRVVNAPPELRVIRDFLSLESWPHFVQFFLPGVVERHQHVSNESGFRFQSDLDPGEEPFAGVELFDPLDTIHLSEPAFDRLMSRYVQVIIQAVTAGQRPELRERWWQDFLDGARALEHRVAEAPR